MDDKNLEILKLKRRIDGLEKTLRIVAGHSGRTEKILRDLFNVVSNTLPVPLLIATQEGQVAFFNEISLETFAYSNQDFENINVSELYESPQEREILLNQLERESDVKGFTLNLKRADGSIFPASLFSRKIVFESQNCYLTMIYDLSDLRNEEEKRLSLERQLRHTQKMEAIGIMAGGIAHDFNNLLHAIGGYTQILLLKRTEQSEGYRELKQIESASNRAATLIKQLLTFSRKAEIKKRPVNLNDEIKQVKKMLERTLPKMISINLDLDPNLKQINADPSQVEQIILNTGSNAADAMPDGGYLMLETANVTFSQQDLAENDELQPGHYIKLTISDTGQGMDNETLQNIFEPFFTTKKLGKGTGLGLSSVYGIVKSHNGQISCQSRPGSGTRFELLFPVTKETAESATDETNITTALKGSETILVVDDEADVRDLAEQILLQNGYQAITADSGEEALDIFSKSQHKIDLIILDIGMPGIGGHKCLLELLKINKDAKIIIASGYSVEDEVKKAMKAGAMGFISKPYQLIRLLTKVRNTFDSQNSLKTETSKP